MPRNYQRIQAMLPQIQTMLSNGMTHRQIEQNLGLIGQRPVHELLKRERKRKKVGTNDPFLQSLKQLSDENRILKMETELCGFAFANRKNVKPSVKYLIIYRNRDKYTVSEMCRFFAVSRSGYYSFVHRMNDPARDFQIAEKIRECQMRCYRTYGYRRVQIWLEKEGIYRNPKTVLRIMQKYDLLSIVRRKKMRKCGAYAYQYPNLLERDFTAERPNQKWVTDISPIPTDQGILYLSIIRDLYDNSIVAYQTGPRQNIALVLSTIQAAKQKEKITGELVIHSDQGAQYASQAYYKFIQSEWITPSMSDRGKPCDNAVAENFFSILKTECIFQTKLRSFEEARLLIDAYIHFYNHSRIQLKTKLTPLEKRCQFWDTKTD